MFNKTFVHPILGPFAKGFFGPWKGHLSLSSFSEIPLLLPPDSSSPSNKSVEVALLLREKYSELFHSLTPSFRDHFEPYAEESKLIFEEAVQKVKPIRVKVLDDMSDTLEIAFEVPWDEEHTLGAIFKNWALDRFSGSI